MPVHRTDEGYAQLLRDQYTLLRDSVRGFYAGDTAKAIEIAARVRTLVHQSDPRPGQTPSRPLLFFIDPDYSGLPIFHKVLMPGAVLALNQGIQISGGGVGAKFIRPDFSSPSYSLVSLKRWWTDAYLAMGPIRTSKKQIILDVANKDGGAHVDSEVPVRHAMATEPPVIFGSDGNFTRLNLARGTVGQTGSELLDYLETHFRTALNPVLPAPTIRTITVAAIAAGFRPLTKPDEIRVPFTRGPSFLNVHTDGKWAFYSEIHDGKEPDNWGKDFNSLLTFLHSCRGSSIPATQRPV